MNAAAIAAIIIAVVVILVISRMVRIVPQARAGVVERLGRYVRTQGPGLTLLLPFVDRMRPMIDLREQVVSFPPQPVITSDNLTVGVDSVIYFQVTDPRAASYEIQNYIQAVEQLTITTLRNVIGSLNLEQALTSRDSINTQLRGVLDEATGPWGIRVARVEIKAIDPPPSIQDAMEQQMRADRNKRAIILTAEGARESAIKTAEGEKAAQILAAEGQKQAAILAAEAERQSRILRAEGDRAARYLTAQGQAKAIETTFGAIHAAKPDPALLAYQYLQTLPQLAQAEGNTFWVIPSEVTTALKTLSSAFGGDTASPPAAPQARAGPVTGAAAAALAADGPGQPGPVANGEPARAEQAVAEEAARTREEVEQVEQEVAAVQRQVAEAEGASPR
ncbi:MAG: SPFH/Band 7/PHB domain protein [Actinomycetota bacterium]|nr:SPFH/Band 7/PHB domain protein [Actinomycetota bacterium]